MPHILFWSAPELWRSYENVLPQVLGAAGVWAEISPDVPLRTADYVVYAPARQRLDFSAATRLKVVLSLWAGVESVIGDVPKQVPLTRMVDEGLTQGMVEYVTGHVLRHHLGMDAHIVNPNKDWRHEAPPLARQRKVTILGLGALGAACGKALASLNFDVHGWSRTKKAVPGVTCHHGPDGCTEALGGAEIVVTLLPATPATESVLDAASFGRLARGAAVINPGRGMLIDDDALLAALDSGQVGHATLDAFRTEPLPASNPYWEHPRVTVTPHIASQTRPLTAARVIAENVRRAEAGEPLLHLVDRTRGY